MRFVFIIFLIIIHSTYAAFVSASTLGFVPKPYIPSESRASVLSCEDIVLISLGDSMTQGTMNATNNATNTINAYMQKVFESLEQVIGVSFSQPLFNMQGDRMEVFNIPTNLGVDGSNIFSLEGLEYYKHYGLEESFITHEYLCNKMLPWRLEDLYDKVLYPINLLALKPVSQLDAAIWLLNQVGQTAGQSQAVVIFWMGNNDSSNAALGLGLDLRNPIFIPLPFDQVEHLLKPLLSKLLLHRNQNGSISFEPYLLSSIKRNLTEAEDFVEQYNRILTRLETDVISIESHTEIFLCTLPYYSSVGYLFDSEDMEYYLQKVNPAYIVPATFKRASEPGKPVTNFLQGDRISLFTFFCMYVLLQQGYSIEFVNQICEEEGKQRDGLVLSEEEQNYIKSRIDSFNDSIKQAAQSHGPHVHLIDVGQYLNDILTGETTIHINDRIFNRKWSRGNSFTIDGVHPGYTTHAFIANFIIEHLNDALGLEAPFNDLSEIFEQDPYIDMDRDGWMGGPDYPVSGFAEILFFFKDPDDNDPVIKPEMPPDIWDRVSDVLLKEFLR